MELIHLPASALRFGQVLEFSIYDAGGKLLLARGQVLRNTPLGQQLIASGGWVQPHETKEYQRAVAHQADTLMHQGATLGAIASARPDYKYERPPTPQFTGLQAWTDLQLRAHSLLRDPRPEDFQRRFDELLQDMQGRMQQQPDATLLLLVFEAGQGFDHYSARHGLLVMALAELCARQLGWAEDLRDVLARAAMSMNIAITTLQDRLAAQADRMSDAHRREIASHGDRGAELLRSLGVHDSLWLQVVRLHHEAGPGPLEGRSMAEQMARLIKRADIYAARLSPRRTRRALSAAQAAHAVYLDELQQPDTVGNTLLKAVGLYPPGALVRLASGEVGVAIKRGHSANEPIVASLLGKSGAPWSEPVRRDTRLAAQAIAACLAPHELKLLVSLEKLLKL